MIEAILGHAKHGGGSFGSMVELMRNDRIVAFFRNGKLHYGAAARRKHDGLHAVLDIVWIAVDVNPIHDRAHDME